MSKTNPIVASRWQPRNKKCAHCACEFTAISSFRGVFCSYDCKSAAARKRYGLPDKAATAPKPSAKRKYRIGPNANVDNPVLKAFKTGGREGILYAIRSICTETPDGCWIPTEEHTNINRSAVPTGYVSIWLGDRAVPLHRLALETSQGFPLGSVQCHHICAVRPCCNPEHLQPATNLENTLEMRERHAYQHRIADLEDALRELDPSHPLLWTKRQQGTSSTQLRLSLR